MMQMWVMALLQMTSSSKSQQQQQQQQQAQGSAQHQVAELLLLLTREALQHLWSKILRRQRQAVLLRQALM
jgi:hypothetical protein